MVGVWLACKPGLKLPVLPIEELVERMQRSNLYKDLPRGRKRRGWKKEFLESLREAAFDIEEVPEEKISRTVSAYPLERRMPEISVAAES